MWLPKRSHHPQLTDSSSPQIKTGAQTQPHSTYQTTSRNPVLTSGKQLEKLPKEDNQDTEGVRTMSHEKGFNKRGQLAWRRGTWRSNWGMRCDTSPERKSTGLSQRLTETCPMWFPKAEITSCHTRIGAWKAVSSLTLETFQQRLGLSGNSYFE